MKKEDKFGTIRYEPTYYEYSASSNWSPMWYPIEDWEFEDMEYWFRLWPDTIIKGSRFDFRKVKEPHK